MTCTTHHHACECREKRFEELEAENARLKALVLQKRLAHARALLTRYRNQVHVGHQPHMICDEVELWLSEEDLE